MHITKMQGLGNDYIYLNCLETVPEDLPGLAVRLSDRHFGVGGDGLIAIRPGVTGDFSMDMYNADGSRGAMCGNGIRCVGKYVYDKGLTRKTCLTIDTGAGWTRSPWTWGNLRSSPRWSWRRRARFSPPGRWRWATPTRSSSARTPERSPWKRLGRCWSAPPCSPAG